MVNKNLELILQKLSEEEQKYLQDYLGLNVEEIKLEDYTLDDLDDFNQEYVKDIHNNEFLDGTTSKFRESYSKFLEELNNNKTPIIRWEVYKNILEKDIKPLYVNEDLYEFFKFSLSLKQQYNKYVNSIKNERNRKIIEFKNSWKDTVSGEGDSI